jgi:hypothetical protein
MSVRSECGAAGPALCGSEGELVAVRISIEPRLLEKLLDALARLDFPVNPQLYHDAEHTAPAAVVEFPAWAGRMAAVRDALRQQGLDGATVTVRGMLEEIRHRRASRVA